MPACFEFLEGNQIGKKRYQQSEKVFLGFTEQGELNFGENSIVESGLSRPLAEFVVRSEGASVKNLNQHPCTINSQTVPVGQRRPLRSGDVIDFGPQVPSMLFSIVPHIPTGIETAASPTPAAPTPAVPEPATSEPSRVQAEQKKPNWTPIGAGTAALLLVVAAVVFSVRRPTPTAQVPQTSSDPVATLPSDTIQNSANLPQQREEVKRDVTLDPEQLIRDRVFPGLVCFTVDVAPEMRFPHCGGWARSPNEIVGASDTMKQVSDAVLKESLHGFVLRFEGGRPNFELLILPEIDIGASETATIALDNPCLTACPVASADKTPADLIGSRVWIAYLRIPAEDQTPHAYSAEKTPTPLMIETKIRDAAGKKILMERKDLPFGWSGAAVVDESGGVIATVFEVADDGIFARLAESAAGEMALREMPLQDQVNQLVR